MENAQVWKNKPSPQKVFEIESGVFVEKNVFGSKIDFDKDQLYCSSKRKDGFVTSTGFINTRHIWKFIDRSAITKNGQEWFWFKKESLDKNASSLRYKEAHAPVHPKGHDEKNPTIVY